LKPFKSRSTSEQLADHLRGEILRGAFGGTMPGINKLVRELGVNSAAVALALKQLVAEGILAGQGERRRHRIVKRGETPPPAMRIAFLPFDSASKSDPFNLEVLRILSEHGHEAYFTGKTLMDLHLDPRRVAGMVGQTRADAWVVSSAQHRVLEWFVGKGLRAFSLYGAWWGLPIAGMSPEHTPVLLKLIRRLIEQGHWRIVFLLYRGQLELETARLAPILLDEMTKHGIATSRYNVPKWNDSPEGFHRLLDSMFRHTPPTALIVEEVPHLIATLKFCGQKSYFLSGFLNYPPPLGQGADDTPDRPLGGPRGTRQGGSPPGFPQGRVGGRRHDWAGGGGELTRQHGDPAFSVK